MEKAYQKELQAIAAFDEAKNEEENEKARKLHYEAITAIKNFGKIAIHIWREYQSSREHGNLNLDLSEVIWDEQVPEMVACMKANGIERFTFSGTYTEAIKTAWLFQQEGCVLEGFAEINCQKPLIRLRRINGSKYTDAYGNSKKVPALQFRVK